MSRISLPLPPPAAAILALIFLAAGCDREPAVNETPSPAQTSLADQATESVEPDRIVFASLRPSNWDIYLFEEAGGGPRRLTDHPGLDYEAAFSPDGRYVVFTSERRGNPDLYVIDLQGEATPQLLIDSPAMEDQVAFSPDGRTIAFAGTHNGNTEIYTLPFLPGETQDMSAAHNLSRNPGGDFRPAFSPDGRHVAFSSDRDTPAYGHPAFSFSRQREGEIYIMDIDGKHQTRLTDSPAWDGSPQWTADGGTLYFYSGRPRKLPGPPTSPIVGQEGGFRIWAMNADGSNARPITPENLEALAPARMPNGRIAFQTREGHIDWMIKSVRTDGSDLRLESDRSNRYWSPDFHPVTGAMIVHGTGPATVKTQAVEEILGQGPLLAADYPVVQKLGENRVSLYPMRHTTGLVAHPFLNKVAVTVENRQGTRMVIADFDGSNEHELFQAPGIGIVSGTRFRIFSPRWSEDASLLSYTQGVFFSTHQQQVDIWLINADGSNRRNLTGHRNTNDGVASFSPDGEKLVFRSARDGSRFDLYTMNPDGTGLRQLTDNDAKDNFPVFSPSGDAIAYASDRDSTPDKLGFKTFDIYILALNEDGSPGETRRITDDPGHDSHPWYSPDGEWILYSSEQGGITDEEPLVQEVLFAPQMYGELYAYRLRDGLRVRVTHNKWEEGNGFWLRPAAE